MLNVEDLAAGYGQSRVLSGIGFAIGAGEVVTLLGRNGMGKTTAVRAIMGLLPAAGGTLLGGRIGFEGTELAGQPPHRIARRGIGLVPEGRQVFPTLTVEENLTATAAARGAARWTLPAVYALFPRLRERRRNMGAQLSGGEQQMLAIGRILRTGAKLLLLDEPTEGLAPVIVQQIGAVIRSLKAKGFTILLVEQNFRFAATVADRHYVVEHGRVIDTIANADLEQNLDKLHGYLGV